MSDSRFDFLSNESISGELLSERLAKGPLTSAEVLRFAIEIGTSLHQVHTSGRVHAQLSPLCIALTQDGARILKPTGLPEDSAGYRAPEQLLGEDPDARCDVFAYGAVIYEIASGKRAFPGVGMELIQRILTQSPEPLGVRGPVYASIDKVIASCVKKDPSARRQRVQNAVIELKLASAQSVLKGILRLTSKGPVPKPDVELARVPPTGPKRGADRPAAIDTGQPTIPPYLDRDVKMTRGRVLRRRFAIIGAALLALAATLVAAVLYLQQRSAPTVLKFAGMQPARTRYPGMPSVSPDGRYVTLSAVGPEGKRMLWLRPLNASHATVIQGSGGAAAPFWSPDSQAIAFFAGKNLNGVKVTAGSPETICPAEAGDRRSAPILETVHSEAFGAVSPNGDWLAYQSNESGRDEVYVQPFAGLRKGTERSWMVCKNGGFPRWRFDSSEMFYITLDGRVMSVSVRGANDGGMASGQPQALFQTRPIPKTWYLHDAAPDGRRIQLNLPLE